MLRRLAALAIDLCAAESAGVSIIESTGNETVFRWRALAGDVEHHEGGCTPRNWSPCAECLKAGHATLYSLPERYFTYLQKIERPIVEGLVIPVVSEPAPLGTIWVVSHRETLRFNAEHARIMASLGRFVANTLEFRGERGAPADERAPSSADSKPPGSGDFQNGARWEREIVWAEYVRRIAHSDEDALQALFEETRSLVFGAALRILSFQADADEITADVYARVWKNARAFEPRRGSASAWLTRMACSASIDRLRARHGRRRNEAALIWECGGGSSDPEASLSASQTGARVREAMAGLPEAQRRAIELFYFSESPLADIAALLGEPLGTVKTRLRLARAKLRRLLAAWETPPAASQRISFARARVTSGLARADGLFQNRAHTVRADCD